jgi:hypothetical protein
MMTSKAGRGELVRERCFQRACEANAPFVTTINQTLDVLLNPGR